MASGSSHPYTGEIDAPDRRVLGALVLVRVSLRCCMRSRPRPASLPAPVVSVPRPISILHVDAERGFSGGEVQVLHLLEGLRTRGHANLLACPPGSKVEAVARQRGFETRAVAMRGDLDLAAVAKLRRVCEERDPDLVHLHTGRATWLGGLAARWAERPAITTRRMDRRVKRNWRTRLIYEHLVRRAVAIAPAVARCLTDAGVRDVVTIPSAVDPDALTDARPRDEVRAGLDVPREARLALVLAALVRRKGLDVLLRAFERLDVPGALLWIAGEGPERERLEEQARASGSGSRVRFLGRREDKAALLAAADVVCLPSRQEGLGVAALEAMAVGRPVVASRVGGLGEAVVHGRTGLLVEPEDEEGLAAALQRLLGSPEEAQRLGAEGPGRVAEGFRVDQMVASYEDLYRELLAGSKP